jgi:hypothetical protein
VKKFKLDHLWWVLLLILIGIGWAMNGNRDLEDWKTLYSLMAFSNLLLAAMWILERGRVEEMRRLLDPELQRRFR